MNVLLPEVHLLSQLMAARLLPDCATSARRPLPNETKLSCVRQYPRAFQQSLGSGCRCRPLTPPVRRTTATL